MVITNRQQIIFLEILKIENINIKPLADKLKLAEKTITKEIKYLNMFFKDFDTEIKITKHGIILKSIYNKSELFNILKNNQKISIRDELLLSLLFSSKKIKIKSLSDDLYTSKSTVNKILNELIKDKDFLIEKKQGYVCSNMTVENKILKIVDIISFYVDQVNYRVTFKRLLEQININILDELFQIDIQQHLSKDKVLLYTDESIKRYYLALVLKEYFNVLEDFSTLLKYRKITKVDIKENFFEIYEICRLGVENTIDVKEEDLIPLVNHVLLILDKKRKYNQTDTYIYWKQLQEFNQYYPLSTEVAKRIFIDLKRYKNIDLDDIEIYFISLHVQTLYEKQKIKDKKKILVICEYGLGVSNFLVAKLERKMKVECQIKSIALNEYLIYKEEYKDVDLIVTTIVNLPSKSNYIYISPFLSDIEIKKVQKQLMLKENKKIFKSIIQENDIYKVLNISKRKDLFKHIENKLEDYVKDGYIDSLLKRSKDNINITNIMLPHGDPNLVKKNKTLIFMLTQGQLIDDKDIKYIIVNCWNNKFMKTNIDFVKLFFKVVVNQKNLDEIFKEKSEEYKKLEQLLEDR